MSTKRTPVHGPRRDRIIETNHSQAGIVPISIFVNRNATFSSSHRIDDDAATGKGRFTRDGFTLLSPAAAQSETVHIPRKRKDYRVKTTKFSARLSSRHSHPASSKPTDIAIGNETINASCECLQNERIYVRRPRSTGDIPP
ncbi:hypothetical protein V9T40_013118 [Parthenolecanium corni]|uniref:Uncharacterized protein n=1 Tax=Parthenolecanium corni TaxID=536013 RepID=A0AAN9TYK6_9HEMI